MIAVCSVAIVGIVVAAWAKNKARTWTPPDHTLALRLAQSHSVRM